LESHGRQSRPRSIYTVIAFSLVLGRAGLSPFRGAMGTAGVAKRPRLERVQPGRDVPGMPIVLCLSNEVCQTGALWSN